MTEDDVRASFESWCKKNAQNLCLRHHSERPYHYSTTLQAWDTWQASRAALLAEQAKSVPVGEDYDLPPLPSSYLMTPDRNGDYEKGYHAEDMYEYARAAIKAATQPAPVVAPQGVVDDSARLDRLDELVEGAFVGMCFEIDGGVHLTIEAPSTDPVAYRHKNTIRDALDAAIKGKSHD